ncbi:MAG TPA: hypothetical protein VMS89_08960 [Methanoregulaceae archaeon]|nr:hypothetical protein [Methanoregulaceae archaeon]
MNHSILVIGMVLAVAFVLTAGCTQNPSSPVATQTPISNPTLTQAQPQTTAALVIPKTTGMGTPGPTESLPVNYMLEFQVQGNGNTANPYMAVTLMGGNGLNFDSRVDVTFTKPDGTSSQGSMLPPFHVGQQVTSPCSTDKNRVEIWVTAPTVGKIKTYDGIVPFQSINP